MCARCLSYPPQARHPQHIHRFGNIMWFLLRITLYIVRLSGLAGTDKIVSTGLLGGSVATGVWYTPAAVSSGTAGNGPQSGSSETRLFESIWRLVSTALHLEMEISMSVHQTKCVWSGKSGTRYLFWIYPIGTSFDTEPGNYIFAKKDAAGNWVAVYLGETSDLSERFDHHHRKDCIKRNGATHIHAHLNLSKSDRIAEETDLRHSYDPPCNRQ